MSYYSLAYVFVPLGFKPLKQSLHPLSIIDIETKTKQEKNRGYEAAIGGKTHQKLKKGGLEKKKDETEYGEIRNVLLELAEEISNMTETEKLLSLRKIVQTELRGNSNNFWTTITKKMLVNENLTAKINSMKNANVNDKIKK